MIKSLIPLIEKSGAGITQRMYEILFSEHPEIKPMFEGVDAVEQHKKLANMIVQYAHNIDAPENLLEPIETIAQAHVTHGDLKASNFLSSEGGPKIIDLDSMRDHDASPEFQSLLARDLRRFMKNWDEDQRLRNLFMELIEEHLPEHSHLVGQQ